MYLIAAVVLVWLAASLLVGVAWAVATYRPTSTVPQPALPVVQLPRPRAPRAAPARVRETAGSR